MYLQMIFCQQDSKRHHQSNPQVQLQQCPSIQGFYPLREKLPLPPLEKEESLRTQEAIQEVKVDAAPQQVLEKEKTLKVADGSEATHESISVREQTSQGSAPLVDEEVQQKQAASDEEILLILQWDLTVALQL